MNKIKITLVALASAMSVQASGGDGLGSKFQTIGNWNVMMSKDAMTDKPSCLAIYKDRTDVQLTAKDLFISYRGRGGVSGYQYRLGDAPALPLQLASDQEKKLSFIDFEGKAFDAIVQSDHLRVRTITIINSVVDEDLDISKIGEVVALIRSPTCGG